MIFKQIEEIGLDVQKMSSETLKDESVIALSGKATQGTLIPFYEKSIDYANYNFKFKEKYGIEPTLFSDYGYDSLMVISKAIKNAESTKPEKIKNELYKLNYNGATGIINFDSFGEVKDKPFTIYKINEGKLEEASFD